MSFPVHADRSGRVLVSQKGEATAMAGTYVVPLEHEIPLPEGSRLVPLGRVALGRDRGGRARAVGTRWALGAILPPGFVRLQFPAYADDPAGPPLPALPYAAVAADARGDLVVAAAELEGGAPAREEGSSPSPGALREHPANALVRQLARCARENECRTARAGIGTGALPVPLGAPDAERPHLPVDLRSGYPGRAAERAALRPSVAEIVAIAAEHLERGGRRVAFGRACDGDPLLRIRTLEEAVSGIRARAPGAAIALETSGADPGALRRAIDAGVDEVTVRLASARPETYELIHGPVRHRWGEVRASLQLAAQRSIGLVVALLVLPGLSDRPQEIDAIVALLDELKGGRLELRDLGADPLRVLRATPHEKGVGMRSLLERVAGSSHFRVTALEAALV